ncbi:hypothetical protein ACB094_09G170300 [Castanea mollissima]
MTLITGFSSLDLALLHGVSSSLHMKQACSQEKVPVWLGGEAFLEKKMEPY